MGQHGGIGPAAYVLWVTLLILTQVMLALWVILSRYLQTKPDDPAPALRLVFIISMLAEGTLLFFHTLPTTVVRGCIVRVRPGAAGDREGRHGLESSFDSGETPVPPSLSTLGAMPVSPSVTVELPAGEAGQLLDPEQTPTAAAADHEQTFERQFGHSCTSDSCNQEQQSMQQRGGMTEQASNAATLPRQGSNSQSSPSVSAAIDQLKEIPSHQATRASAPEAHHHVQSAKAASRLALDHKLQGKVTVAPVQPPARQCQGQGHAPPQLCSRVGCACSGTLRRNSTGVRPELVMQRGLSRRFSRMRRSSPRLARCAALATLTVSFSATCGLQLCAPGFVDPSLVQLVNQFTAVGTALGQALILRHPLHWTIWPCSLVMTGGAAMVIVPSLGKAEAGGLGNSRGWLGFAMAVVALLSTVVYFITLQATRHMGYTATQLQHYFLCFSILVFMALSLPINGAAWKPQFHGWTARDWLILVFESSVAYVGSAAAMQHCVWRLGAPMVSMSLGLRLVFTACLTKPILGSTVISSAVQVTGVILTAGAVTVYVALQWRVTKTAARIGN